MEKVQAYESYPARIVLATNAFSFAIWLAGAFIIWQAAGLWVILYLAFILALQFRLIRGHCPDCYYYGKRCANGMGKLSSLFFKKGNPADFCKRQMTWKDIVPDFMVSVIPMAIGVWILITGFSWVIAGLVALLFVLSFPGNAFVHGSLVCKNCRQRELGCPAEKLFQKK
jgi:hypothetical protein